jgi:penicillin amidase
MRWLRWGASAAGATIAAAALCAWLGWRRAADDLGPALEGELALAGLAAPVRIARDPFGVPHVEAASELDAWLGLGFAHVQDRLWQMELLRRTARGRLAELFGSSVLQADRLARLLLLGADADAEAEQLAPASAALLDAYCRGVNAWLEQVSDGRAPRPFELRWLGVEPEPWRPSDTLAILRWRAWSSARVLGGALLLDRLVRELGGVAARDFFPVRPSDGAHDVLARLVEIGRAADTLARAGGLGERAGSLGFAVGAARSATGLPLLASDPHVALDLPPVFYLAHLRAPGLELGGATWPGAPVFWTGTNGTAAWGQVTLHASVSDLYEETFRADPPRYERNGRWHRAERRTAAIAVRGGAPVALEIVRTRNGPVLTPLLDGDARGAQDGGRTLTLRWAGFGAPSGIEPLLRAQRARSWLEFREALRELAVPAATFLYADRSGEIGAQVAGRLPERGIDTALLPAAGSAIEYRWRGSIPFDELPSQNGRELPFLVASTHPPELEGRVSWLWSSPGGAARLRARLAEGALLDLGAVAALQAEQHSQRGPEAVRRLLQGVTPRSRSGRRVLEDLREWDGATRADSRGAALYHVFRQQLARRILSERLPAELVEELGRFAEPAPGVVLARFVDRRGGEAAALVAAALEDTWSFMRVHVNSNPARWTWASARELRVRHAFERLGGWPLQAIAHRLGRGPFAVGGDPDSIWTMHHAALPGDDVRVGPGLRYAVDLADPAHAQIGLAGGQSGFAGSAYYDDALRDWLEGRARPLWMHRTDIAYHTRGTWALLPGGG